MDGGEDLRNASDLILEGRHSAQEARAQVQDPLPAGEFIQAFRREVAVIFAQSSPFVQPLSRWSAVMSLDVFIEREIENLVEHPVCLSVCLRPRISKEELEKDRPPALKKRIHRELEPDKPRNQS